MLFFPIVNRIKFLVLNFIDEKAKNFSESISKDLEIDSFRSLFKFVDFSSFVPLSFNDSSTNKILSGASDLLGLLSFNVS